MWAAGYGKTDTVQALLAAGAKPGLKDDRGKSALDIAREQNYPDTVKALEAALRRLALLRLARGDRRGAGAVVSCGARPHAPERPVAIQQGVLDAAREVQCQRRRSIPSC